LIESSINLYPNIINGAKGYHQKQR